MPFPFLRARGLHFCVILLFGHALWAPLLAQERGGKQGRVAFQADTVTAGAFDEGRLWSVVNPPLNTFAEQYGVGADEAWAEHLRRGALRLPTCSAALVSERGLALTAAHCVREHLEHTSPEEVGELDEEKPVSGLYADQLVETRDVTAEVQQAAEEDSIASPRARASVQQRLQSQVEEEQQVQVVAEAGGTQFTAYVYRRYRDLRLVFLPEQEVSRFGGIEEALTFPRHALDVAVLRVYADEGTPLEADHFFQVRTQGVRPEETVFAVGHPADARRAQTYDQVAFQRDVVLPSRLSHLRTWEKASKAYLDTVASGGDVWRRQLSEGQRTRKKYQLQLDALQNEILMTRFKRGDDQLRRRRGDDVEGKDERRGLLDSLAEIQERKRRLAEEYRAFGRLEDRPYASATLRRSLLALQVQEAAGARRDSLIQHLVQIAPQPAPVDAELIAAHLETLRPHFDADSAGVRDGREDVEEWATTLVANSIFARPEEARQALRADSVPANDPALSFVEAVDSSYIAFRERWGELKGREERQARRLHRAQSEVRDSSLLRPKDRAPRLTAGHVRGFPYNGTMAPPFTTFYGLFAQHSAFDGEGEWSLPESWRSEPSPTRSQPLNIVSSTDRAGGMSGAPLLNQYLQVVGVTFDGNVQSAIDEYLFLPSHMRTVSVDLRGFREALTTLYEADALAEELFGVSEDRGSASR